MSAATGARQAASLQEFRAEYRSWLRDHVPAGWKQRAATDPVGVARDWMAALDDAGYAAPSWPLEHGGMAASLAQQIVMFEENAAASAPSTAIFGIGLNHAGSTLIMHGDEEQKQHLPRIRRGEEIWCQGFSEPNAGSDLASLRTRAVRDGDAYVVNGQKVWSSMALDADWCLLLARTDLDAPRRQGISYLLLDLSTRGVEVRSLRQITGSAEFCEIFLTDVIVPVANRVGPENDGWKISQTTLSTERGPFFLGAIRGLRDQVEAAITLLRETTDHRGRPLATDAAVRQRFARDVAEVEILGELYAGILASQLRFGHPGPESSIIKLYYSEVLNRLTGHLLEDAGVGVELGSPLAPEDTHRTSSSLLLNHLGSFGLMIGGGTNEIQRTLIGERVLGLPREPKQT